jgi:hypothetical protein
MFSRGKPVTLAAARDAPLGIWVVKVAVIENDLAASLQHRLVFLPELVTAVVRTRAFLPLDVQGGLTLHRRPRRRGNHGDAACQ